MLRTEYRCTSTIYRFSSTIWHCMKKWKMEWNTLNRF
jgi:hypothetical protein